MLGGASPLRGEQSVRGQKKSCLIQHGMASLQPKLLNTLSVLSQPRKGRFCDLGGFRVQASHADLSFLLWDLWAMWQLPGCARVSIGVQLCPPRALQGLCLPSPGMALPCTHCQAGDGRSIHSSPPLPILRLSTVTCCPTLSVHIIFFKELFPSIQLPEFTCRTFPSVCLE